MDAGYGQYDSEDGSNGASDSDSDCEWLDDGNVASWGGWRRENEAI